MGKKLGSIKALGSIGCVRAESSPVFVPTTDSLWESAEELTPSLFVEMEEKYGDEPEWMKISGYREGLDKNRHKKSELLLNLTGKNYWFPLTPSVYENFMNKIVQEDRGVGLKYLQGYIRRYKAYKEVWPSKRYVKANKINNSFIKESERAELPGKTGITRDLIDAIFELRESGLGLAEIARRLRLSRLQVESVINCSMDSEQAITDDLIRSVASGELSVDEALSSVSQIKSDTLKSKQAFRNTKPSPGGTKYLRLKGQKPRSPRVGITPSSIG